MNNILVVIPTYNESLNIQNIVYKIQKLKKNYHILIVDGNSTDDTVKIVNRLIEEFRNIYLIKQKNKNGIGGAYCDGFSFALKNKYNAIIQIDSDMSHDPSDIPRLVENCSKYDLVIGSRYVDGISIVNWPLSRLVLSYCANIYAKILTGMKINDCTSGFKCIKIEILKNIDLNKINSQGYSFQIEMNYLSFIKGYKIKEIPIIFKDRIFGKSKISKKIILEAIFIVPFLRFKHLFKI